MFILIDIDYIVVHGFECWYRSAFPGYRVCRKSTTKTFKQANFRIVLSWSADAHTSVSFSVPDNWKAGRIWVRDSLILFLLLLDN